MSDDLLRAVQDYVEANIGYFHERRLATVRSKRLNDVLKRKNPYLFRAKSQTVIQLVYGIMDAFLSSQEEGLFGTFLEGVAVFVAGEVHNGYKPAKGEIRGIDLIMEKNSKLYILELKSGPNWGNSSQVQRMLTNFKDAIAMLQPQCPTMDVIPINGCMYGKERSPLKTGTIKGTGRPDETVRYWKLCGQDFWHFISDNRNLYTDIIEPLGFRAKEKNAEFLEAYDNFVNNLVYEFLTKYRNSEGGVAWDRLTEFVSKSESEDIVCDLTSY